MLRKARFSIARLMVAVLVAAIASAALRNSSEASAGIMLLLTCGVLMLALVGALYRGPNERAWWLGFALFGGGYFVLVRWMSEAHALPTITLAEYIASRLDAPLPPILVEGEIWNSLPPIYRIIHCLWALGLAELGSILAGVLVSRQAVRGPDRLEVVPTDRPGSWSGWRPLTLISLLGFWSLAMIAAVRRWPAAGLWAGLGFLLTCGLLGIAAMGAAHDRGRRRPAWLGAALFGFGYLILSFGHAQFLSASPHLPTERMINSLLRPGGPPVESGFPDYTTPGIFRVRNQLIRRKLDQLIPMHFSQETPLDEVLKYIKDSTRDANSSGIPIYIDPIGLQKAERSLNSTVRINLDAITVRDGLRLCLKQLGLGYTLRSGFLMVSDEDSATIPVYEDPVQVVGHSFLSLIAAGLGAVAAPFVANGKRRTRRRVASTSRDSS